MTAWYSPARDGRRSSGGQRRDVDYHHRFDNHGPRIAHLGFMRHREAVVYHCR